MRKAMCRLILKQICLLMSGYILLAPLATTGYAAEKTMFVPDNMVSAQQIAINFGNSVDPVASVIRASEIVGFNPKIDTFSLVHQDASQATVQVMHNGTVFDIRLEASGDGSWVISTMSSGI